MKLFFTSFRTFFFFPLFLTCLLLCLSAQIFAQSTSPTPKEVAVPKEPLSLDNVFKALKSDKAPIGQRNLLLIQGVKTRGISFILTDDVREELSNQGANKALLEIIQKESEKLQQTNFYYRERGDDFRLRKNYPEAIANYNKTIELNPEDRVAYNNRGHVYETLKRYDEAIADFSKVIELDPTDRNGYNNRGVIYYYQSEYQKAIEDYTRAIQIDPNFAEAYVNRANAFQMMGQLKSAEADRQRAQELKP